MTEILSFCCGIFVSFDVGPVLHGFVFRAREISVASYLYIIYERDRLINIIFPFSCT